MERGSLTVISGFSGVGKGTVVKSLLARHDGYALSISATTRQPRPGEAHGREYFFMKEDDFMALAAKDGFIEYTSYCGHHYGTLRDFVESKRNEGINVILEIEVEGAINIRRQYPDSPLIFIMPPSAQALHDRLAGRQSESEDVICQRLSRAAQEADSVECYDYIFVNEDGAADACADRIHDLISALAHRTSQNRSFIDQVCREVRSFATPDNV